MNKITFDWSLSHAPAIDSAPQEQIVASVPGAVQLDYAVAKNYAPYYFGTNYKQFDWMEDEYFFYDTLLDFVCSDGEAVLLTFEGIDYSYEIVINGKSARIGEGAFTPVVIDVTEYSGKTVPLRVIVKPIPKLVPTPQNRSQAAACCKPPSSYGWDWHPRLVPSGLWGDVYLDIVSCGAPRFLQASYCLSDDFQSAEVNLQFASFGNGVYTAELVSPDNIAVTSCVVEAKDREQVSLVLRYDDPELWYPRGYGEQPIYSVRVKGAEVIEKKLGFRKVKLILNKVGGLYTSGFPKGPEPAPMQIEINGKQIFAKGSNWVNTEIFPCLATKERYDELIDLAYDANMNIFRMWGGQYINHEYFYDKCDELGIMIWQEFMLSCNKYPDSADYLAILEQEAVSIIKKLLSHPCLTLWCGGNELFNNWSGLTNQSHALRLLDKLCFEYDRNTPFNMTSPLYGVSHGSYLKVVFPNGQPGHEFIQDVKASHSTAYTEFGCNGGATKEYILKYIMSEGDYNDCNADNEVWKAHHAFRAWSPSAWLGIPEVEYYFGSYKNTDDLLNKTLYLQAMCYTSMFEEMRRQAPVCSMSVNWDFNEPWPCAAGNSLINWPAEPKPAYYAVKQALRPTILSLNVPYNRYLTDDKLVGEVWLLNDSDVIAPACEVNVYILSNECRTKIATIQTEAVGSRINKKFDSFELQITEKIDEQFSILLESLTYPEWSSEYLFVHNTYQKLTRNQDNNEDTNDFSDFFK